MTDDATITLHPTDQPRLEAPSSNGKTPPASTPTPDAPFPTSQGAPMAAPASWDPAEAAAFFAAIHSLPGVAYYGAKSRMDLAEAWRAEGSEIAHAGRAMSRVLGQVSEPGAPGPVGLGMDLAITFGSMLGLFLKHRDKVNNAAAASAKTTVKPLAGAPIAKPASPGAPAAAPPPEDSEKFGPDMAAFLAAQAQPTPTVDDTPHILEST